MKKIAALLLGLTLSVGISNIALACGPAEGCTSTDSTYTLSDITYFKDNAATTFDDEARTIANLDLLKWGVGTANFLDRTGDYVKWVQEYNFNPQPKKIQSAALKLSLVDDEIDAFTKQRKRCEVIWDLKTLESAAIFSEDGSFLINNVNTGTYTFNLGTIGLKKLMDGKFEVLLFSTLNDFSIASSELDITYCGSRPVPPPPVPEPGTLVLLGLGMGGLAIYRKRRSTYKA